MTSVPSILASGHASRTSELVSEHLASLGQTRTLPEIIEAIGKDLGLHERFVRGVKNFLAQKQFLYQLDTYETTVTLQAVIELFTRFARAIGPMDPFKSNAFKYMTDSPETSQVLRQIGLNAEYWVGLFGADFFARSPDQSDERKTFMKEPIPGTDCYISCKGGSGVGTFSIDLAIGLDKGQDKVAGELWRTGFDSEQNEHGKTIRIIRTGGPVSRHKEGYAEKTACFEGFMKKMKCTPQRALGILCLYIAYDLGATEMKCISLPGARNKKMSLIAGSGIQFDYTAFARSLGFTPTENQHWLSIPNFQERFYDLLLPSRDGVSGVKHHECRGLDSITQSFAQLGKQGCPLTICASEARTEVEKALRTFRIIQGRD